MTGPPEGQEEAPRGVTSASGGKRPAGSRYDEQTRTVAQLRPSVKHGRACNAYPTWRTWPAWLRLGVST